MVRGDLRIFSSKRSFLLRKRMMEVSPNHLLLQIESNNFKLSCIRFWKGKDAFLFSRNVLHCASKEVVSLGRGSKDSCMDGEWGVVGWENEWNLENMTSVMRLQLCWIMFPIPWSRPRAALGRTRTWQHRRWWRWRPRNSGSTFSAPTSAHPRRRAWSWGSWRRSVPPRCPLSSLSSSGCLALSAGSPLRLVCLGRRGSWKREG